MLDWSDKLPRLLAFDAAFQRRQPAPDEAEEKENGGGGDLEEEEEDDAYANFDRGAGAGHPANPDAGNVISLGSFTKILSPALRLGWLERRPPASRRSPRVGMSSQAVLLRRSSPKS